MQDPETTTVFTGPDGRIDTELPAWFAKRRDTAPLVSFSEAIRKLPRAIDTAVAYHNPYSDEWVETERFNAIVEPSRLREAGDGDTKTDSLFNIPTDSYVIVNPVDIYGPLADVLRDETVDGTPLSELCFGEIRQYRGGGEVHIDIMFDGLEVTLPGRGDPITMGVTTGYDFFGDTAVYVEGFARDTACANSIRALTDRQVVKHVGDVGDFEAWWRNTLEQLDLVASDLHGFICDARDVELDFTDVPFDLMGFYELLGFPTYLAEHAADDARATAVDPFAIDLWTLHSGATYALTHFFRGKESSTLQRYTRLANDLLFNPELSVERVKDAFEQRLSTERDGDSEQPGLEGATGLAQVQQVREELDDLAVQFEEREAQLRARFDAMTE